MTRQNKSNSSRADLQIISSLVNNESKILDIGCGEGDLLEILTKQNKCDARGVEISHHAVSRALMKGLSVIQGDAEDCLGCYPDNEFDYAIMSHTIQATRRPDKMLQQMLRISDKVIVSLPNFANFRNRFHLFFKGTMPVNESIPYQWYETPNIHFCSIRDFKNLCDDLGFKVLEQVFLLENRIISNSFAVNLVADYAIFLIEKDNTAQAAKPQKVTESNESQEVKDVNFQPAFKQ